MEISNQMDSLLNRRLIKLDSALHKTLHKDVKAQLNIGLYNTMRNQLDWVLTASPQLLKHIG